MATAVRITPRSWETLKEMADETGETMQAILERAVESYRRQRLLEKTNEAYAALKADPAKWSEEVAEREEWDTALNDGLEGDR